MRKRMAWLLVMACLLGMIGCGGKAPVRTVEGNLKTYGQLSDGTWECEGYTYQYRLVIHGRMPNAVQDTTYVYLSNMEDIPFYNAMMASGVSSNMNDYFSLEEAVLVEIH